MHIQNGKSVLASRRILVVLGVLALVVSLPVVTRTSFASMGATIALSYSVVTVGTHAYISVVIEARDSQFPNFVVASMTSYFNGSSTAFYNQAVLLTPGPLGGVAYNFIVPFQGAGSYLLVGNILNLKGTVILGAAIDPLIEPEWK